MSTAKESSSRKGPVTKEKLRSIMEAASALTALGDEETVGSAPSTPIIEHRKTSLAVDEEAGSPPDEVTSVYDKECAKRYIPDHKKPDAALTFPEKLMNLMRYADEQPEGFCISWLQDGKSFVIRNADEFTKKVLPNFFKATKFSSFTRKLYRWGFRQVNRGIGPDDPIIFGNEHFQRDSAELMAKMRSVTAASTRKAEAQAAVVYGGVKRPLVDVTLNDDRDQKRALLGHLIQQKAATLMSSTSAAQGAAGLYGSLNAGGPVSLTSALNPAFGLGMTAGGNFGGTTGLSSLLSKHMDIAGQTSLQQANNANLLSSLMQSNMTKSSSTTFPSANSTAEIVNAAISALRYAN